MILVSLGTFALISCSSPAGFGPSVLLSPTTRFVLFDLFGLVGLFGFLVLLEEIGELDDMEDTCMGTREGRIGFSLDIIDDARDGRTFFFPETRT